MRLFILTTHFGTNFSGGSTATCEIFDGLQDRFEEVVVLGTELGEHPFRHLRFIPYGSPRQAYSIVKEWAKQPQVLFYGDFYNAYLFGLAGIPFSFTYHDNWPELGTTGLRQYAQGLYFWPIYRYIFRKAAPLFVVSEHKRKRIAALGHAPILAPNGFAHTTRMDTEVTPHILMVGNVDARKYQYALKLFKQWAPPTGVEVHIYGRVVQPRLLESLLQFSFVKYCGYAGAVPYGQYRALLHTSAMENLPMVLCEAILHGVPIVSFEVGGNRELVDGTNGYLVPPYQINALAGALNRVLAGDVPPINREVLAHRNWTTTQQIYASHLALA